MAGAIALLQQALQLDPDFKLAPEVEAKSVAAAALREKGRNLAKDADVAGALGLFQQALQLNPGLILDPQAEARRFAAQGLIEKGERLVREGKVQEALAAYTAGQEVYSLLKVSGYSWFALCWFGSLWGHVADVMEACEQSAIVNAGHREARGLARALTGNVNGAIDDFQAFVDWTKHKKEKALVQRWLVALRAGQNPFTPEELETLRHR